MESARQNLVCYVARNVAVQMDIPKSKYFLPAGMQGNRHMHDVDDSWTWKNDNYGIE